MEVKDKQFDKQGMKYEKHRFVLSPSENVDNRSPIGVFDIR